MNPIEVAAFHGGTVHTCDTCAAHFDLSWGGLISGKIFSIFRVSHIFSFLHPDFTRKKVRPTGMNRCRPIRLVEPDNRVQYRCSSPPYHCRILLHCTWRSEGKDIKVLFSSARTLIGRLTRPLWVQYAFLPIVPAAGTSGRNRCCWGQCFQGCGRNAPSPAPYKAEKTFGYAEFRAEPFHSSRSRRKDDWRMSPNHHT